MSYKMENKIANTTTSKTEGNASVTEENLFENKQDSTSGTVTFSSETFDLCESDTWENYTWKCAHCSQPTDSKEHIILRGGTPLLANGNLLHLLCQDFNTNIRTRLTDSLEELRSHSKEKHSMCHAFICADCNETFIIFEQFVDHVRKHRDGLRLSCQFCDAVFPTLSESTEHINSHYVGTQKICDLCGESLPFQNTLEWHKRLYGQIPCGEERRSNSWDSYDWGCQECPLRFSDARSLRTHAQRAHGKCFAMRCADCSRALKCYKTFVAHVITHRPYLQNFCQYCNSYHNDAVELNQHIIQHITSQQRPCNVCGQTFNDNIELAEHKKLFNTSKKTVPKGVPNTKKAKKKEIKLIPKGNIKKSEATMTTADLKCNICGKRFTALANLTKHVKIHDHTRPRNFTCQACGRAFLTAATLRDHSLTHSSVKPEICQVCNKGFYTKHKLKAHIITHSELRPFICNECGNGFKTKRRLKCHLISHSDLKPFSCMYCKKEFKFKENLKTHLHQHTGARPYRCEVCERTFTNWTNCNKHMMRKHGVTLARTKITSQGRIAIDRKTGEVGTLASDSSTMEWLNKMMQPERPVQKFGNHNPEKEF